MYRRMGFAADALTVLLPLGCGGSDSASRTEPTPSDMAHTIRERGVEVTLPPDWIGRSAEGSSEHVGVI